MARKRTIQKRVGKVTTAAKRSTKKKVLRESQRSEAVKMSLHNIEGRLQRLEQALNETEQEPTIAAVLHRDKSDDYNMLVNAVHQLERKTDALSKTMRNIISSINHSQIEERSSGSRRSSLGKFSEEGGIPIDQRVLASKTK